MQFILKNRTKTALAIVAGLLVYYSVYAAAPSFWTEAAQSGTAEVALGQLAVQKAQSERVRQFAQQMVNDHTAVNDELKSIAAGKSVALPTSVDAKHSALQQRLSGLSGDAFDREFMKAMVKDHEAAVKLFERESLRGGDAEAKTFAGKHLPALQQHLQMARTIYNETRQSRRGDGDDDNNMNSDSKSNSNKGTKTNSNRHSNSNANTN